MTGAGGTEANRQRARGPLGATLLDGAVSFAVVSTIAEAVELCLFDEEGIEDRLSMQCGADGVWRTVAPGVEAGTRYGFRVHGPFDPARGLLCDPARLLVDPYALAIDGAATTSDRSFRTRGVDSSAAVPRSVVVDSRFDWGRDDAVRVRHNWEDTVIYEVHVKGATIRHPGVDAATRGTYAGLASDAMIGHLCELGVTAVELLPIHEIADEPFLAARGLTNYWGYSSLGFLAPTARYSALAKAGQRGGQVDEFKAMVLAMHRAGIEVILDVVYNHTAEGDGSGPTLSLRGLDAPAYYRLDDGGRLVDTTGCGNSINSASTIAVDLIVDSLRYWAAECHVDGFRFDLAPTLARPHGRFDSGAPFLQRCAQDPVLARTKLIAEPWDVGQDDSFALGAFPAPFREWNGRYRDAVRDFWRSEDGTLAELATRFAGSSDFFASTGRVPSASVNFITSHDGFTLEDLVSYDAKHNDANGQDNSDGTDDNRSWNCGVEGDTSDPEVRSLRGRQARALLSTLLLSSGVPMLLGGDELGRSQGGNNNAFCQDNETSWFDWSAVDVGRLTFTKRLIALRRSARAFRRVRFLTGAAADEFGWYTPEGRAMAPGDWEDPSARCVAVFVDGRGVEPDPPGNRAPELDDYLVLVNGWWEPVSFRLPEVGHCAFIRVLDSFDPAREPIRHEHDDAVEVAPRSVVVLRAGAGTGEEPT